MDASDADFELAKLRFKKLYKKAKQLDISDEDLKKLTFVKKHKLPKFNIVYIAIKWLFILLLVLVLASGLLYGAIVKGLFDGKILAEWTTVFSGIDLKSDQCVIPLTETVLDLFRPPVDCEFCRDIKGFDRVQKLSQDEFVKKYAYSGRPVIVTDATVNWTAANHFSFDFFRKLYKKNSPVFGEGGSTERECQFFPYKTTFGGLYDVFRMPKSMREMKGKPWYIGWSNCDPQAANRLRQYYDRPYFLSQEMESSRTDWIFMGTPGYGAHIHIDSVQHSSWQAQIQGNKTWTLEPPPECYYQCVGFKDTIRAGEVIVLDTNRWFHGTNVVGDKLSIVIGSEYD